MTELRRRVERLEHLATNAASVSADANDLANFPGNKNLVAGSGITLTPDTGTLTIAASSGGLLGNRIIRKDFHGVTASDELYAYVSSPMVIDGVSILANTTGDLVVDVRKVPVGSFPATGGDSICASAKPTLTADQTYLDTTLTGWDKVATIGDTYTFHIDSVTTVTDFEITLYGQSAYGDLTVTGTFTDTDVGSPLNGSPLAITGGDGVYALSGSPYSGTRPAGVTISVSGTDLVATGNTTTEAAYVWTERVTSGDGQHYDVSCNMDVTAAGDPYWSSVVALLHFDGTDFSTVITDETGRTWTVPSSAYISTDQSVFGGASLKTSWGYGVQTADSTDFYFTGDFTIEFFFWNNGPSGTRQLLCGQADSGAVDIRSVIEVTATRTLKFWADASRTMTSTATIGASAWNHIAVTRAGSVYNLWLDGTSVATFTDATIPTDLASVFCIGKNGGFNGLLADGYFDEARITKGVARYTSAFTPPTLPFPNS